MSKNNKTKQKEYNLYDLGFTDEMIEHIKNQMEIRNITLDEYMEQTIQKYMDEEERREEAELKILKRNIDHEKQNCKELRQFLQTAEKRLNEYEKEYNKLVKSIEERKKILNHK